MKPSLLFTLLLCTLLPARAQTNPYGIHDSCYVYFREADRRTGRPGFSEANEKLLAWAKATSDTKAETLYYVEEFKNLSHAVRDQRRTTPEYDRKIEEAQDKLVEMARKYGYPQYYYYSYEVVQTYYFNHDKYARA